jgi:hypothetical protein
MQNLRNAKLIKTKIVTQAIIAITEKKNQKKKTQLKSVEE